MNFEKIAYEKDIYICPDPQGHRPVWIGFVLVEGKFYIEAETGKRSSWGQAAFASRTGQLTLQGRVYQVNFTPITDDKLLDRIQAAYYEKYGPDARLMEAHAREACFEVAFVGEIG
ncbi:MAG: DUF2255 family protein [Streptococcaceae bacterium]|jgi:hypothetical protein|nr:DUF2255 family protein [Streptococcaceae bacterium]